MRGALCARRMTARLTPYDSTIATDRISGGRCRNGSGTRLSPSTFNETSIGGNMLKHIASYTGWPKPPRPSNAANLP